MLLQRDMSFGHLGEIGEGGVAEFAAGDHLIPLVAAHLSFEGFYPVEVESKMSLVLDEPYLVPFAHGVGFGYGGVSGHIVETAREMVLLFVVVGAYIVEHLHFGPGEVGCVIFRVLLDIEDDAAVTAFGYPPFEVQLEVLVFVVGDDIAAAGCRL